MTLDININLIWIFLFLLWTTFFLGYFLAKRKETDIRKDSIKRQKSVVNWEVYEKILPMLPDFEYNPRDLVFIWKWIDYLIFDGLSDWNLKEIVFLELKTWKSNLNKNEKQVKDIINKGKIYYSIKRQ